VIRLFRWLLRERTVCFLILAAGVAATAIVTFAIAPSHASDPDSFLSPKDGPIYRGMAESAVAGDEFRDPNGERSHKMSPVFPLFISAFMLILGTDETTVRIAAFASYLLAIAALHRTTSDLFGRRGGLLFAAGYAACFGGALDFVAKQHHKDGSKAKVTCAVSIGPREGGGFGLAVKLRVEDPSLPQAELAALAAEAHERICPYSHATRGNVDVQLDVAGA